jgi:hypothetical protein
MNKLAAVALSFVLAACAGSSAQENPGSQKTAATPDVTGTWRFALEQSDVATAIREECAGDAACWQKIATQSAKEKIRFTRDASGAITWTSFETDGNEEHVFLTAPIELSANGTNHLTARVSGTASGLHADRLAKSGVKLDALDVEIVDAKTIALTDPKKGRLVYTKE